MANALYDHGRENFLNGNVDWTNDDIKVTLVDSADYSRDLANDDFYDDVTVAGREAVSSAFTTKTTTAGVADADDVTFSTVSGDQCEYLVLWMDDGVAETSSPLIACIDTATGLPVTPNGGDITVTWDSGANKIFKL